MLQLLLLVLLEVLLFFNLNKDTKEAYRPVDRTICIFFRGPASRPNLSRINFRQFMADYKRCPIYFQILVSEKRSSGQDGARARRRVLRPGSVSSRRSAGRGPGHGGLIGHARAGQVVDRPADGYTPRVPAGRAVETCSDVHAEGCRSTEGRPIQA